MNNPWIQTIPINSWINFDHVIGLFFGICIFPLKVAFIVALLLFEQLTQMFADCHISN